MTRTPQELVEQYVRAANARDWQAFAALLHEDIIYEIPQLDFWPASYEPPVRQSPFVERY